MCAQNGGGGEVNARYTEDHSWQKFKVTFFGDNQLSLQAANGQYVSAEYQGGGRILANSDITDTWEKFEYSITNT